MPLKIWIGSVMIAAGWIAFAQPAQAQNDCHANAQTHFVQGLGVVAHSHAQNCDIVVPQGGSPIGSNHCHTNVQSHGPGAHSGGASPHSHTGWNCGYQAAPGAPGMGIQLPGVGIQLHID